MCDCKPRAGREARIALISLAASAAVFWAAGLVLAVRHVRGYSDLDAAAAVSCTIGFALTVAVGVTRKRDHIAADAAAAAREAEIAALRTERFMMLDVLRNATEDVAAVPAAVPEDNRPTRPFRVVPQRGGAAGYAPPGRPR